MLQEILKLHDAKPKSKGRVQTQTFPVILSDAIDLYDTIDMTIPIGHMPENCSSFRLWLGFPGCAGANAPTLANTTYQCFFGRASVDFSSSDMPISFRQRLLCTPASDIRIDNGYFYLPIETAGYVPCSNTPCKIKIRPRASPRWRVMIEYIECGDPTPVMQPVNIIRPVLDCGWGFFRVKYDFEPAASFCIWSKYDPRVTRVHSHCASVLRTYEWDVVRTEVPNIAVPRQPAFRGIQGCTELPPPLVAIVARYAQATLADHFEIPFGSAAYRATAPSGITMLDKPMLSVKCSKEMSLTITQVAQNFAITDDTRTVLRYSS